MIHNETNIKEISIPEAMSNLNGKTSISALMGTITMLFGLVYFGFGIFAFFKEIQGSESIVLQSLGIVTLGSSLLLAKGLKPTKDTTNTELSEEKEETSEN